MYEIANGARYAKITISGSETVKFPCAYGVFGVKGDNITVKLSETASGDGVYNTADGGGYILIAHYAHLDTVYLVGSGEVIVWAGNSPLDNPLKKAMSGYTPVTVESLSVSQNGTYTAPSGKAYSPVVVDVQEEPWQPLQDGYSNFWFELTDDTLSPWLNFSAKTENAVIDWGDGTGEQALTTLTSTHTYAKAGRYIVKCKGATGIARQHTDDVTPYINCLQYVELNNEVTSFNAYVFCYCISLKRCLMPNVSTVGSYAFEFCSSLESLNAPLVSAWNLRSIRYCFNLKEVTISGAETLGQYFLQYSLNLKTLTLPSTITSIAQQAISACNMLSEIHCQATTPPTLGTNVFLSLPSNWICYVPVGTGNTYKSASGWSTYSDHILEEGQEPTRAMLSKFENSKKSDDTEIEDKR